MGYQITRETANRVFEQLKQSYDIFAPKFFSGEGCFSDTDIFSANTQLSVPSYT